MLPRGAFGAEAWRSDLSIWKMCLSYSPVYPLQPAW